MINTSYFNTRWNTAALLTHYEDLVFRMVALDSYKKYFCFQSLEIFLKEQQLIFDISVFCVCFFLVTVHRPYSSLV